MIKRNLEELEFWRVALTTENSREWPLLTTRNWAMKTFLSYLPAYETFSPQILFKYLLQKHVVVLELTKSKQNRNKKQKPENICTEAATQRCSMKKVA